MNHFFLARSETLEYCFNVETSAPLDAKELLVLRQLLADGFVSESISMKPTHSDGRDVVELGPRMNFATAYSTNIVAICHTCGLDKVVRIERSRRYYLPAEVDKERFIREHHDRISYLPGAREFLEAVSRTGKRVLLVTNSHPDTLALKQQVTGLSAYFDGIHSAHTYGFAKEQQDFWHALRVQEHFDPETTMFVDDTEPVLQSATTYGIGACISVIRPDTSEPPRKNGGFAGVDGIADLL